VKRARDWIFTIPALIAIGVILVTFDIAGRIALLFNRRAFEWTMAGLQRSLLFALSLAGITFQIEGLERIQPGHGYVFISNHQSMFDIPLFGGVLIRNFPKYIAKRGLGKGIPSVSLNLTRGGNALIDRENRDRATEIIEDLGAEAERRDVSVVIFPEGTRSLDGELGAFRPAGTEALLRGATELPVVPTAIDGSWRILENNLMPIPFGAVIRIRFGEPIARRAEESALALLEQSRAFIEASLTEWRTPAAEAG
jgi:1-acyl-sn-glycerol-3-phosphate acyltransferase